MAFRMVLALLAGLAAGAPALASAAEDIGIPDCDRFITRYEACVMDKVPPSHRVAFSEQIQQLRITWKSLAENPQTRVQLEEICRTQSESMRRSMESFGCEF